MAELPRYRKAGVLLADVPRIDFVGQRSAAEVSGQLAKSLDRMSNWAFGKAAEQAKEEGLQYGAENPVTQRQLLDAVTAGEDPDKLFQKKNTVFGDAARAAQVAALTSEIEMTAQQQINMLKLGVERGEVDLPKAQSEIQAILDGYGKSLVNVDPKASLKLRASLATNANAAYLSMTQSHFKRQDELKKQAVDQWIDVTLPDQIRTIIEAGDTVDPTTGGKITVQQRIDATVRQTLLNNLNTITDPVFARQAMVRYDKIVSDARVGALTKIAMDPAFARDPVTGKFNPLGAVTRADAGDFGAYSSVFAAMPADEQLKVRTALRQASADRYTAEQRAEAEVRQRDQLEVNNLVVEYAGAQGDRQRAIVLRLREISTTSGAITGTAINTLVKAKRDGDGGASDTAELHAQTLIRRGGVTSIDEVIRRVPGLSTKQIKRLGDMIMDAGDRQLTQALNRMAGIPDGPVAMSDEKARKKELIYREAERAKQELIDKNGAWDAATVEAMVRESNAVRIMNRDIDAAKKSLAYLSGTRGANLTADTSEKELRDLGYGVSEITRIRELQRIIRGQ